jgi:hypothetical protein
MALGISPNYAQSYRPRTWPDYTRRAGQGYALPIQAAQARNTLVEQRAFFSPAFAPRGALTCGMPGMPPCDEGVPVAAMAFNPGLSGFAGFGRVDAPEPRSFPGFCASVRTLLSELEWLLDKVNYTSPIVQRAKFVYDDLDSNVAYIPGTGGCDRDAQVLTEVISQLRADMQRNGMPPPGGMTNLTPEAAGKPPDIDPTVKFVVVGGLVVAGIIGLAVLTGNAAAIAKVFK